MGRWLAAVFIVVGALSGCSSHSSSGSNRTRQERALIAVAVRTEGFRGYGSLFPHQKGTRHCEVRAGPLGNVFGGSCSTRVELEDAGSGRVIFKQSIEGQHWWVVRVKNGRGSLIRDWGAPLVEGIS
jgi:hypothetical protein